ncbi:MAG: pre-peptidase C-terminal domain-containing protein [Chloroflexi bacterium]|nr:pre-peptidase C-terminal domain-containing protein [Chloroflexota bacterium]
MDRSHWRRVNRLLMTGGLTVLFLAVLFSIQLAATSTPTTSAQTLPQVFFSSASVDVAENIGVFNIVVARTLVTATQTVRVNYQSFSGSATGNGVDFTNVSGVLEFPTNVATRTIAITIIDDSIDEPNEFFYVELLNPINATLGTPSRITITILDNDLPSAPTATPGGVILLDEYEPNNSFREAFALGVGLSACRSTFWPVGDVDYFRFFAKSGSRYRIATRDLVVGIDTLLRVYDPQGNLLAQNDDIDVTTRRSQVEITAGSEGFYFAYVENKDPSDPTGRTYCLEVLEVAQPTATPSQTPIAGADACEFNSTLQYACLIGVGLVYNLSFVPTLGSLQDTDYFRLWMKAGLEYTCETLNLSPYADTNMIFLDGNGRDFNPNLGNDDKAPGDRGSKLSIRAPYTGYLSVVVGPVNPPLYDESPLHTYDLLCTEQVVTPTPAPTATNTPAPSFPGSGSGGPVATPTSFAETPFPTVTPIDFNSIFQTLTPPPPPNVEILPLPTATPASGGQRTVSVNVTLFYDSNNNYMPELTEGIVDTAVALYDNNTGQLLAFGYTNEAGMIRFDAIVTSGALRVVVPFLNYSQVVLGDDSNILIRVAPQPLPGGIP